MYSIINDGCIIINMFFHTMYMSDIESAHMLVGYGKLLAECSAFLASGSEPTDIVPVERLGLHFTASFLATGHTHQ